MLNLLDPINRYEESQIKNKKKKKIRNNQQIDKKHSLLSALGLSGGGGLGA